MEQTASPGTFRLTVDLCGAAAAWIILHTAGFALSSYACYPHNSPAREPMLPHFGLALGSLGIICTLAALLFCWSASASWRGIRNTPGARRFMAGMGLLMSLLFLVATALTTAAILLISPCSPWK